MKKLLLAAALTVFAAPAWALERGTSFLTTRLDDPRAVPLTGAAGDGKADDSAAIQAAIDKAAADRGEGIVFIPEGRYRISRTIYVWPAVRVIGWGAHRPVLVLGDNTPGFARGIANMVIFAGARPHQASITGSGGETRGTARRVPFPPPGSVPPNPDIADANPGTFYSAMSNIDFEIGKGNAGAVAIRFHGAQHDYLSHMDFHIGSGLAALNQVANQASDLRFFGGRYGIIAEKPSPAWQFTLLDSQFEGQREAAIREHEAQLTLINATIRDVPVGIDIDPGTSDWLWVSRSRFENVGKAGIVVSNEASPMTQINVEGVSATATPVFARFRESGKTLTAPGAGYDVERLTHGLVLPAQGRMGRIDTIWTAHAVPRGMSDPAPGTALAPAIRPLPPSGQWVNVRSLGVKGDGKTDDTAALQHAIDTTKVLYLPSGRYIVHDTIRLKPDTVLIGLHPSITQIDLPDRTPGYQGVGAPKALLETPPGGDNIVSGIGLYTFGINPRAVAALWQSSANSLMDDVRFLGGHGTNNADGSRYNPYDTMHAADPDPHKRWDGQYPSLWVHGGGGTFNGLWSVSTYAQAGVLVSDTKVGGSFYELSNEHHVRVEIAVHNAENFAFYAPQTEEEAGESPEAISLEISDSKNILVANYHAYRVTRTVAPNVAAVKVYNSTGIAFRNVHMNAESGLAACDANGCGTYLRASKFPFENSIRDMTRHIDTREREFAALDFGDAPAPVPQGKVEKLEDGFYAIAGATVDANGKLYFVDHHQQRIYSWADGEGLRLVRDNPLDPVNLAFDKSGNLLVLSSLGPEGTLYAFKPGTPATELTVIPATASAAHPGALAAVPNAYWYNAEYIDRLDPRTYRFATLPEIFAGEVGAARPKEYVSPDGSLFLPQARVFQQGPPDNVGWRFSDTLDSNGLVSAAPGSRVFVTQNAEARTYSALVGPRGNLTDLKKFAERGGESVVSDGTHVYLANGQVLIYGLDGKEVGRIDVPDRPTQLVLGGADRRTLYILTHHALYRTRL